MDLEGAKIRDAHSLEEAREDIGLMRGELRTNFRGKSLCGNADCEQKESLDRRFKICSGCKLERYCSEACQKHAWKTHKNLCVLAATRV